MQHEANERQRGRFVGGKRKGVETGMVTRVRVPFAMASSKMLSASAPPAGPACTAEEPSESKGLASLTSRLQGEAAHISNLARLSASLSPRCRLRGARCSMGP